MIDRNHDCIDSESVQKFAEVIWYFRGYIDKDRFDDDLDFLVRFVRNVHCGERSCASAESVVP